MGKSGFDDIINQEVQKFVNHINDNHTNQPVNIDKLFHQTFITIIWRILHGESLPVGDSKLNALLEIEKCVIEEAGYNIVMLTFESDLRTEIINKIGLSKMMHHFDNFRQIIKNMIGKLEYHI